ncbi:MAG: hypothetical protein WC438_03390 [Candidatus Pacearchaeota archaeon]
MGVEDYEPLDIEIKCPNCGSNNVVICESEHGYYHVSKCYDCGYEEKCEVD